MERAETDDSRRILVVANEAVIGPELTEALLEHLRGRTVRVCLIAPILVESGLDHEMGQVDQAVEPARRRLERSLEELRRVGVVAVGEVADADPMLAISDELQKFGADEIVLVSHSEEDRAYAEKDLLERVHHDFEQPVTQLVVTRSAAGSPHLVSVEHEDAGATMHEADFDVSLNYPPLRTRDVVAMAVGIFGSLALVAIAAACALGDDTGRVTGVCAAKLLIAIGALLVNGAHVVALIFFQSLRYEGVLERFASTFTIAGTSLAVVVSLLL